MSFPLTRPDDNRIDGTDQLGLARELMTIAHDAFFVGNSDIKSLKIPEVGMLYKIAKLSWRDMKGQIKVIHFVLFKDGIVHRRREGMMDRISNNAYKFYHRVRLRWDLAISISD